MIRILHVIGAMNRAGAEAFLMNVYRSIDRGKIQFDFLVSTKERADFDDEIESLGGRVFRIQAFNGLNHISYRREVSRFFREHPEHKIVHGHIGSSAFIYLAEAKKAGKYTIAHSHNTYGKFSLQQSAFKLFSFPTRFIADAFFACSPEAGSDRFGHRVTNGSSIYKVIWNGVNVDEIHDTPGLSADLKSELGLEDSLVVGHVGRFERQKNHHFLVDIFSKIRDRVPQARLVLLGDGSLREDIEAYADDMGLSDNIVYAGVVADPPNWLKSMDVFLFPSLYEGLSVALVEAQAAGLPCVISDVNTDSGCLTPWVKKLSLSESADTWAQCCIEMAEKREEAYTGSPGLVKEAGFSIIETTKELEGFYLKHASSSC